ncbi:uncharacterized protein Bfra_006268, partial [Botrytis fragariae]
TTFEVAVTTTVTVTASFNRRSKQDTLTSKASFRNRVEISSWSLISPHIVGQIENPPDQDK